MKVIKDDEISDELLMSAKHNEWREQVVEAARKWVKCKGRYHSEINAKALIEIFEREPKP